MANEQATATAEQATPDVKKELNSENKKESTSSQRIFSDLKGRSIPGVANIPGGDNVESLVSEKKEVKEEPKAEVKPAPKYLSSEDFADALVKLKVDGVEEEAKFQDVIRRVQLDKHLTSKGQKLSEEEKRIREKEILLSEREKIINELMANQSSPEKAEPEAESSLKNDPYVRRLEADLQETKRLMQEINAQTAPMRLSASLERVDKYAKENFGLNDFMDYRSKIQEKLVSLPIEVARELDNENGWLTVYKDIKLKEFMEKSAEVKKPVESATIPVERTSPTVIPIESGKGSSKGFSDDESSKYRSLIEKAKRLTAENSPERHSAWEQVLAFQSKQT